MATAIFFVRIWQAVFSPSGGSVGAMVGTGVAVGGGVAEGGTSVENAAVGVGATMLASEVATAAMDGAAEASGPAVAGAVPEPHAAVTRAADNVSGSHRLLAKGATSTVSV